MSHDRNNLWPRLPRPRRWRDNVSLDDVRTAEVVPTNCQSSHRRGPEKIDRDTQQPDAWIASFHADGQSPPLFCVCGGGGDVLDYRDFALALPAHQPTYVFGLPPFAGGRQFPTVQHLAEIYLHEVRKLQPQGPYRLCGHSFGGIVVYEMAVQLAHEDEEVSLVALIDTLHPAFRSAMSPEQQRQFRATYISDRLGKYARNLARGRIDRVVRDAFDFVWHRCKRKAHATARVVFGRLDRPLPRAIRSDELILVAAWHSYQPSRYSGRLLLFNAAGRAPEYRNDPTLGWKTCAADVIEIHTVPGDHYSILHQPDVRALVELIVPHLART